MIPAEAYYTANRNQTSGEWPTLLAIYENRMEESEGLITSGQANGYDKDIAAVAYYRMASLYEQQGDAAAGAKARARAEQLAASD